MEEVEGVEEVRLSHVALRSEDESLEAALVVRRLLCPQHLQ